jgi:hypothetical protein
MKILGIIKNGKLALSEFTRAKWNDFLKDPAHEGRTIAIQDRIPESLNQRGFYQGGVLRLWAYLNGLDFRDGDIIKWLHNEAKKSLMVRMYC